MTRGFHEDFSRAEAAEGGSERAFGLVFAAVFAAVGLWPLLGGDGVRAWALAVAALFGLGAALRPGALRPLNRLWLGFGRLLHRVTTPLVMGFLFFGVVTPTALLMRAVGKDPLRLRFEPGARSYWIPRRPAGPDPETMRNQF